MRKRRPLDDGIYALLNRIIKSSRGSVERQQLPVPSSNHLLETPKTQPSSASNCNVDLDITSDFLIK